MQVELSRDEWQQVLTVLGNTRDFPWSTTNPLLMKIGTQLQQQDGNSKQTNSEEMPMNIGPNAVKQ
jgi:hypothetical protein